MKKGQASLEIMILIFTCIAIAIIAAYLNTSSIADTNLSINESANNTLSSLSNTSLLSIEQLSTTYETQSEIIGSMQNTNYMETTPAYYAYNGNQVYVLINISSEEPIKKIRIYSESGFESYENQDNIYLFYDEFNSGLTKWTNFGSPSPSTFSNSGFMDSYGWASNGDGSYGSGSVSKQLINISDGIIFKCRVKQTGGNTWDMIYDIGIGKLISGYSQSNNPAYMSFQVMGINPDGGSANTYDIRCKMNSTTYVLDYANDQQFATYEIAYDPFKNTTYYRNGTQIFTTPSELAPASELPVLINGRDYHNTNYVDYIYVLKYFNYDVKYEFFEEYCEITVSNLDAKTSVNVPIALNISELGIESGDSLKIMPLEIA